MAFQQDVQNTPDIETGYKPGLQALGGNSSKINISDKRHIHGSVDIDSCIKLKYPRDNSNRWDYVFDYKKELFFVEVHPAITCEVKVVLNKLEWLKNWLRTQAPLLDRRKAQEPYHWLQSGRFDIPKGSREFRLISENGLKPKPRLVL